MSDFESEHDVAEWMRELTAIPLEMGPLPNAHQIWWKAELLKRWDARRHAVAPIERAEPVQVWIGLAGAAVLLVPVVRSLAGSPGALVAAIVTFVALATCAIVATREFVS